MDWSYCLTCDFLFPAVVKGEALGCPEGECVIVPVPSVSTAKLRKKQPSVDRPSAPEVPPRAA